MMTVYQDRLGTNANETHRRAALHTTDHRGLAAETRRVGGRQELPWHPERARRAPRYAWLCLQCNVPSAGRCRLCSHLTQPTEEQRLRSGAPMKDTMSSHLPRQAWDRHHLPRQAWDKTQQRLEFTQECRVLVCCQGVLRWVCW